MTLRAVACAVVCLQAAASTTALGQHDPHRNAVRHVAAGKLEAARKELAKAEADDPETMFVEMLALLAAGDVASAAAEADKAVDAGLPVERLFAGPRAALAPLRQSKQWRKWSALRKSALLHGPMVGSVTDRSARIWLRTAQPANVSVAVIGAQPPKESPIARTDAASDYTAVLRIDGLDPQRDYRYQISIDGKPLRSDHWRFRTFPRAGQPGEFSVAFGGGAGFVPKWEYMWDTIRAVRPDALLMLGDNVYIDDPTKQLTNHYCYYRRQSRPEWRRLVAGTSVFAIYDDHDFGTNDCVPGPEIESPPWKRQVWNMFRQNWVNPSYGGGPEQPGCWFDFYIGDVHFIMLDGRYYRSRKPALSMLGPVQKAWLLKTLKQSRGSFKVLASPVPWTVGVKPGSRDPWDGFPEEREEVFSFIESQSIDGVFLIAADRHRTDLRITSRDNGYDLYEFESSKLTNRHTHNVVKTAGLQWGYNKTCSFALMKFDTTGDDPSVRFEARTIDGEVVFDHLLRLGRVGGMTND
jgi:alkaline phosphatase D